MKKSTEYLLFRLDSLNDEKYVMESKKQKVSYEINGIREKIREMMDNVDAAYEIFSPIPKENSFAQEEIDSLKQREKEMIELYESYEEQLRLLEADSATIRQALEEEGYESTEDYYYDYKDFPEGLRADETDAGETLYGVKILEKQELERQRIARDLHDSSVQVLTNLIHKCEICSRVMEKDPIRAKLELEVMSKSLRSVIDEMKTIIFDLRPMSFDDLGVETTLNRIIDQKKKEYNANIVLKVIGEQVDLSQTVMLTFIRIIQEALNNALEHSFADNIYVILEYTTNNIYIIVEDDGVGFDINIAKDNQTGFGLSIMKERVYLLAGELKIQSETGKGTRIEISIPIE